MSKNCGDESTDEKNNTLNEKEPLKDKINNESITSPKSESSSYMNEFCGKLINFSDGLSSFSNLAITFYFKDNLHLSPSYSALIQSILSFPRIIKPFFGFISDVIPFFGYKRKSYLILNSIIIFICWISLFLLDASLYLTIFILFIKSLSKTFLNACSSAVLVEISKNKKHEKDEKKLEKFNTSIIYINLGTILSSTTRGIALEYFSNKVMFLISGILSCLDIIAGVLYHEEKINLKIKGNDDINNNNGKNNLLIYSKKEECNELLKILKKREIILISIYMLIITLVPSYYESSFYYLSDMKEFSKRNFGHLTIILMFLFLFNSVLNKNYLNKYSKKKVIIYMTILSFLFSSLYWAYIFYDLNSKLIVFIGVSLYISFKSLSVKPLFNLAFLVCPKGYEGSIMGLFYSLRDFGDTCASLMGSWLAYFLDIQKNGYQNYHLMIFIINIISLLPLGFIWIINDKSIEAIQNNKNNS